MDPVVAEVNAQTSQYPGDGGVPRQGVEAVVGVDVDVHWPYTAGHQHPDKHVVRYLFYS